MCGARNLGEALRRVAEGAAMIRTKGEAGVGQIVEAVRHIRTIVKEMKQLTVLGHEKLVAETSGAAGAVHAADLAASSQLLSCGIATPAHARSASGRLKLRSWDREFSNHPIRKRVRVRL